MRPQIVLPLVLVAVAGLIVALLLLTRDKGDSPRSVARIDPPTAERTVESAGAAPGPRAATRNEATPPPVRSEAQGAAREQVAASVRGTYANLLRVQVLGAEGEPVADAAVELTNEAGLPAFTAILQATQGTHGLSRTLTQTTGTDGIAVFNNLDPDNYALYVEVEGYARLERGGVQVREEGDVEVVLQLDRGHMVRGYVTDGANTPLAEAEVLVVANIFAHLSSEEAVRRGRTATTDANGFYEVVNLAQGIYMVSAHAEGFGRKQFMNVQVPGPRDPAQAVEQDFQLEPGFVIAGRVMGQDQRAIANARVQAFSYQTNDTSRGESLSGPDGRFEIPDLSRGAYALLVTADGWAEARLQRIDAGRTDVLVEMEQQGGVMGSVLADNGGPLDRFRVSVRQVNPQSRMHGRPIRPPSNVQHPEGQFQITGLDRGLYVVDVEAIGYAQSFSETFEVERGQITPGIQVQMHRGGALTGRVIDSRSGEPIVGARVQTQDNTYQDNAFMQMFGALSVRLTTERSTRTDAEGRFHMDLLTPATYQVIVDREGFARAYVRDLEVVVGETATDAGTIGLGRGASVEGTVYDSSGAPVINAEVRLAGLDLRNPRQYQGNTDSRGRYRIDNVAPGGYTMSAVRHRPGEPFSVLVDMQHTRFEIQVSEGREQQHNFNLPN
jgi:protocatechuate 3,4-dioxygenase beta subunit